jgi:hypothetical protein
MRRAFAGILLLCLMGCGESNVGGGGIEIPNGLDVTVHSSGAAARGTKVRLLARESWSNRVDSGVSVVLDSATTDSVGHVFFPFGHSQDGWWVEVVSGNQGARMDGDGPSQVTLDLKPLSTLSGNLGGGPISGVPIHLAGSDRVAVTDAAGAFRFDSLPQGTWNLVARPHKAMAALRTVELALAPVSAQGLIVDTTSVLLDDFSDGSNTWNLHGLFGSGYWWVASADSVAKVFGTTSTQDLIATDGSAYWLSVPVKNPTQQWAGVGIDMGPATGILPELSGFTGLRIRARGTGTWTLSVEELSTGNNWTADFTLDTVWTTVQIPASALTRSGDLWNAAPRHVRQLVFQTMGTGRLDLGGLWLDGASISDWKGP